MFLRNAVAACLILSSACAVDRPAVTATDAHSADAPVAAMAKSTVLDVADSGSAAADVHAAHDHGARAAVAPVDAGAAAQMYSCPMHPEVRSADPKERCPKCGMRLEPEKEKAAAVYVCPMHPEVESTDPKFRCPKCGMKLELKK